MTYNVFSGTLNPTINQSKSRPSIARNRNGSTHNYVVNATCRPSLWAQVFNAKNPDENSLGRPQ